MGSGISKKLQCPDGYDKSNFKDILMLYDKLDSNGDQVVDADELDKISDLHVLNKIRNLNVFIDKINKNTADKFEELENISKSKIKSINTQLTIDINEAKLKKSDTVMCATKEISKMENMSKEDKSRKFMTAVSDKNGNIEFWSFFHYMKDRTNDIKNILW